MQISPDAPAICMTSYGAGTTNLYIDELGAGVINKIGPLTSSSFTYKEIAFRKQYVLSGEIKCIGIMLDLKKSADEIRHNDKDKRPFCLREMTVLLHEPSSGVIHLVHIKYPT
jgi:hypothetical protein